MNIADYSAAEHLAPEDAHTGVLNGAGSPKRPPAAPGIAAFAARSSRRNATALSSIRGARSSWRHYYPLTLCLAVFVSSTTLASQASADDPALSASGTNARLAASTGRATVSPQAKATAPSTDRTGRATAPVFPATAAIQLSSGKAPAPAKPVLAKATGEAPAQAVPDRIAAPEATARPSAHIINVSGQVTRPNDSGVAKVRVAQATEATNPAPAASAPVSSNLPPVPPAAIENLGAGKKVIKVNGLQLPPLSKPLPMWMQAAAVRVEKLDRPALPAPAPGKRLAQNPDAPPVRQPAQPVTNSDRLPNQIQVAVSTFVVLLTTTDLQTVAVADPAIADVAVVNARAVLVNGKAPGVTSLVIVDKQKIRQYTVRVTSAPGTQPVDVATAIGLPGVSVRPLRDALVLEGEVASADEARRAVEIAGIYSPKVINQLTIRGSQSAESGLAAQIQDLLSDYPGVKVRVAGDSVILSGTVDSPRQITEAETIARAAGKNITIVNLIRLPQLTFEQARQALGAAAPSDVSLPAPTAPGQLTSTLPFTMQQVGDQIILEGMLPSQATIDAALATAARTGLSVVNRLQVLPAPNENQGFVSLVANAIGRPGVIVRGTPKRLVLEGVVPDTNAAVAVEQIARGFAASVDNLLLTPNPQAVDVDVSIVEINRNDLKNLGIKYAEGFTTSETFDPGSPGRTTTVTQPNGTITTTVEPGTAPSTTRTVDPSVFEEGQITAGNTLAGFGGLTHLNPFRVRLNALYTNGKARLLSNPRTMVLSGRTATFQVGGQIAVPVGSTTNNAGTSTAVEFKDFGVLVDVVPVTSAEGVVTLRVRTEVSQPDFTIATTIAGTTVPGFSRRASVTEVTVEPGGSLALSGLIQNNITQNMDKIPVLGDLPILGTLFRSKRFQRNETELVIFVTPRMLKPNLAPGQLAPAAPAAVGENTNMATQLGNGGIPVFNSGQAINSTSTVGAQGGQAR